MAEITQLTTALFDFLSSQDKNWSLCTFPFMVSFLVFFAIYIGLNRYRPMWTKVYIIAFSLFFAFKANGVLMWLLPIITISSWYLTRFMMRLKRGKVRKIGLALVVLTELIPLLYYKYTNFTLEIFHELLRSNFSPEKMLLPVGISFFTFQAISYTVDVYKGRYPKTAELIDYAFYLTFFPLLIAGPITRAEVLLPQVQTPRNKVDDRLVYKGLWLIICGLIKKALIADYIAQYNNIVFDAPASQSSFGDLMGVLGFSVQIYFDFAGYSDLAIGVAALMGYELKDNFRFPYQSLNLTEFWHRWHIALSTWFRDYLTFSYVSLAWIFFRAADMTTATTLINNILHTVSLTDAYTFLKEYPLWLAVVLISLELHSIRETDYNWLQSKFINSSWLVKLCIFAVVMQLVINLSHHSIQPFIYTQF